MPALSQRGISPLGTLVDYNLGYRPTGIAIGSGFGNVPEVVVLASESPSLRLYGIKKGGKIEQLTTVEGSRFARMILAVDLNADGVSDYVTLTADGMSISILERRESGFEEKVIPLTTSSQRMVAADINNDKVPDILLFGKNRLGVTTILRQSNGEFVHGPILFPDVSVGDLRTMDLNGDGIRDIILLNWLSNEMEVHYGISRMIFSEQATLTLPDEPSDLDIVPVTKQRLVRFAITFPNKKQIRVFSVNSLTEFQSLGTITLPEEPQGVKFVRMNNDQFPDIVTATTSGISIAVGKQNEGFAPPIHYGVSRSITDWVAGEVSTDGLNDLAFIESSSRRLILLANDRSTRRTEWSNEYAVGSAPAGLAVSDVDGDGLADITVANSLSSSISVLYNNGNGLFEGQQSLVVTERPMFLRVVPTGRSSEPKILISHPTTEKITIAEVVPRFSNSTTYSIPTGEYPYVMLATEERGKNSLQMLVRYRKGRDSSVSISSFEQIDGGQFLERSLKPSVANKIVAVAVSDKQKGSGRDVFFAAHSAVSKLTTVYTSVTNSESTLPKGNEVCSFVDSSSSLRFFSSTDVDGDGNSDLVFTFGSPQNAIGIAYGRDNTTYSDSLEWVRGVNPLNEDVLFVQDVNGNGRKDIVLLDRNRKGVYAYYGTGTRGFGNAQFIMPADAVNSIRLPSLRQSTVTDLVMSHRSRGTVSVHLNPFRR